MPQLHRGFRSILSRSADVRRDGITQIECVVAFLILLGLVALWVPAFHQERGGPSRPVCKNSLKTISLALHAYHEQYGSFPPAYIADGQGRPMHSWRVLLLPLLGKQQHYNEYRFDEPWNGPHNSKLSQQIGSLFNCPDECRLNHQQETSMTSYVAVVGPNTIWPGTQVVTLGDVTDGPRKTIQVAEVTHSGIHWMEPRDLELSQMASTINSESEVGISSVHENGANVAFADSHIGFLSDGLPTDTIKALLTRDGGEPVGEY